MIKANDSRSSIRRHGTSNRKFSHSNRFILQKNSPACTTDAVLRKYGDTSARCTSFGPYFNNGNQNPFYIELAQAENYYGERLRNQASFTVGIYRGEADISGNSQPIATVIATVYII
jgi:hypothetical protein